MEHTALSLGSFCYKGMELDILAYDLFLILIF